MTMLPPPSAKKLGLVIDLDTCVGCHACAVACKEWNSGGVSGPLTDDGMRKADGSAEPWLDCLMARTWTAQFMTVRHHMGLLRDDSPSLPGSSFGTSRTGRATENR